MNTFRKALVPLAFFPFKNIVFAQKKDSIPNKLIAFVTDKFPQARDLNIEYTQLTPYNYSSAFQGADLPDNKVKNFSQVNANANIYFIKNRKWMLSTALNYRYTSIETENATSLFSNESSNKADFHYHSEALNFTYFSKLFNKTAIYSATASVDGSDQHFERLRGMLTGNIILKATPTTRMTLGLAVMIDPSTQVPVLPIFTYEHKFSNGWVADVILPQKLLIRKDVFSNGRISLGSEMNNTSFYLYQADKTYEFRQLNINSGIIYEHNLGSNFIGTLKTGVRATPNSRIFDKEESFKDYIFEAKPKPSFYFNVGVSYNPFGKLRKK
ncbi:DUF6268 family outer membrane beta-barrel protein [Chryseobacterium sp. ERMR1:04]|uniref:DUF6268 family outer membrane beta-barrel protein n=1 Tax=Chryseobacterium sp. ERMR1:04 TaxID=1705393 RepID=UPI0006C8AA84|nr:DUF6268 family outer membrane beta-barrel protein [Chryseobacterium sp. ERMR1:04]KPH14859.1 hypothetical protein AMQ68_05390 [Chryseobacterium sp. ERMR1:04]